MLYGQEDPKKPYIGEVRLTAFTFAPVGWKMCDGQLLNINDYESLYALIGLNYGGDGQTTFGLPDFRGRVPVHQGMGYYRGYKGGIENVPLVYQQLPAHTHNVFATAAAGDSDDPSATKAIAAAGDAANLVYGDAGSMVDMAAETVSTVGNSLPHTNMQPFLTLNFMICTDGLFPSRS